MHTAISELVIEAFYVNSPDSGYGACSQDYESPFNVDDYFIPCSCCNNTTVCKCEKEMHELNPPHKGMGAHVPEDTGRLCCDCRQCSHSTFYKCECAICESCVAALGSDDTGQPESSNANNKSNTDLNKMELSNIVNDFSKGKEKDDQSDPSSKGKNRES